MNQHAYTDRAHEWRACYRDISNMKTHVQTLAFGNDDTVVYVRLWKKKTTVRYECAVNQQGKQIARESFRYRKTSHDDPWRPQPDYLALHKDTVQAVMDYIAAQVGKAALVRDDDGEAVA